MTDSPEPKYIQFTAKANFFSSIMLKGDFKYFGQPNYISEGQLSVGHTTQFANYTL